MSTSGNYLTLPADTWLVTGPRPILIGPFPSEVAALAWGGEWSTQRGVQAAKVADLAPAGEALPVFAPAGVAAVVLKAMERMSDGQR